MHRHIKNKHAHVCTHTRARTHARTPFLTVHVVLAGICGRDVAGPQLARSVGCVTPQDSPLMAAGLDGPVRALGGLSVIIHQCEVRPLGMQSAQSRMPSGLRRTA